MSLADSLEYKEVIVYLGIYMVNFVDVSVTGHFEMTLAQEETSDVLVMAGVNRRERKSENT